MGAEAQEDPRWTAAQRVEGWAGEVRVNLVRLVAILAFYGHHLLNYYFLDKDLTASYHVSITAITLTWAMAALGLHGALLRRWNPPYLKYASAACDAILVTAVLVLSGGPQSPLVVLLFLLVATAPLRLQLRMVWAATLMAILAYAFLCGHAKWVKPEWRIPRRNQVIFALGLACAGVLAGQFVRQARRFAQDYADRMQPDEKP